MNPLLSRLQPYPFERLRQLFADVTPNPQYRPISLGIGEPRHATPQLIKDALTGNLGGLAVYPATAGEPRAARGHGRLGAAALRRDRGPGHAGAARDRLARGAVWRWPRWW